MSDSAEDRRQRTRRGSMLDLADFTVPAASEASQRLEGGADSARGRAGPSSLLATTRRSPRISTRVSPADAAVERAAGAAPSAAAGSHRADPSELRISLGDRISRRLGLPPAGKESAALPVDAKAPSALAETEQHEAASESAPVRSPPFGRDDHYHWHAASPSAWPDDDTRPLLDASILVSAVWRFRYLIGLAAIAGAVLGVIIALSTPHMYYAESRLFIDPREVQVTEDDVRNQLLSTEAMLAITDSQLQILSSTSVLEAVIRDLGLERDPEFNGSLLSGSVSAGLSLIKEILFGTGGPPETEKKAIEKLRKAVSVSRDAKTFVIIVGVKTRDADKSALIANRIVETYLSEEGQAQSGMLERTSESINTRINSLQSDLDRAEREVERFKAENGIVGVAGQYIDDKVILALSEQLANARAVKVGIRVKAENLAKAKLDDVLSGAFPEELLSTNLADLRKQYTQTKATAESLATRLGPRHPQYISAQSSQATIGAEISAELRRIVASSQTELQRAIETEQELASQMAVAKNNALDQSVEFVTLRELERKAAATRQIYEAFLKRSRETSERSNLTTRNIRVISPAEPPLNPMGPSRKLIAIGGMVFGAVAGVGVAILFGAVESIRVHILTSSGGRIPSSPFGFNPAAPDPAPQPPQGPNGGGRASHREDEASAGPDGFAAASRHAGEASSYRDFQPAQGYGPPAGAAALAAAPTQPSSQPQWAYQAQPSPQSQPAPHPASVAAPAHPYSPPWPAGPGPVAWSPGPGLAPMPSGWPAHPAAAAVHSAPYGMPGHLVAPYHAAHPPMPYPVMASAPSPAMTPEPAPYWPQPGQAPVSSYAGHTALLPREAPAAEPARDRSVEQIRREMQALRSRIAGYDTGRRRAS